MNLRDLQADWNVLGDQDPLWAILSDPAKKGGRWDIEPFFETGRRWIAQVMKNADRLSPGLSRNRALDFGCGVGRLTQALCLHFERCDGVDLAPSMLRQAREFNEFGDRCRYWLNSADDLALFADHSFDFICSFLVLQHMPGELSERYIAEFLRILKRGGLLMFQLPADFNANSDQVTAARTSILRSLPPETLHGEIILPDFPGSQIGEPPIVLVAGTQALLRVRVRNRSGTTWPAQGDESGNHQIKVAHDWLSENGDAGAPDLSRSILSADLAPGGEAEILILLNTPTKIGLYSLFVDVVQEGVARGISPRPETARAIVEVVDAPTRAEPTGGGAPIKMHGIPQPRVREVLRRHGASVLEVNADQAAGFAWTSFTYFATKPGVTPR